MPRRPRSSHRLRPFDRSRALLAAAVVAGLLAACSGSDDGGAPAETTPETSTTAADAPTPSEPPARGPYGDHLSEVYDDDATWICRPDLAEDQCRDLDVTVLAPDGSTAVEEREPAADPPVDCFYVYPTVSQDPAPNADLEWTPADNEAMTVVAQAAQFARACRVFAPVYRQVPLAGLAGGFGEGAAVAYADVLDAWKTYMTRWNEGRGVIVIGHSQGMGHLVKLLVEEVDDEPALRDQLVAAYLFGGSSVQAPEGEVVGGTFDTIPACTAPDEVGCVVTWSSWPREEPPGGDGIFGRAGDEGRSLCTDVVELLGRSEARPVAPVDAPLVGRVDGVEEVTTPFVAAPDSLAVSCQTTADHDYLAVGVADADDPRPLDGFVVSTLVPSWGLHLVDMNVALDDLVEMAQRQGEAYAG